MHLLQFLAYFVVVLLFFVGIWKALNKLFGHPHEEPVRRGRVLTEEDFKIFGEDAPVFLWPLKEDDSGHH